MWRSAVAGARGHCARRLLRCLLAMDRCWWASGWSFVSALPAMPCLQGTILPCQDAPALSDCNGCRSKEVVSKRRYRHPWREGQRAVSQVDLCFMLGAIPVWVVATAVALPGLNTFISAILNQKSPMGLPARLVMTPGPMRSSSLSLTSCGVHINTDVFEAWHGVRLTLRHLVIGR